MASKKIIVTGGNSGIGLALCTQLAVNHGCHVFMGSRSAERGQVALDSIKYPKDCTGKVELVQIDVSSSESILSAAAAVNKSLNGEKLFALVNNAGVGLQTAEGGADATMKTNFFGTKEVTEAFLPLLQDAGGRIVSVGSGAGPMYVGQCPVETQRLLCNTPESMEQILSWVKKSDDGTSGLGSKADSMEGYGVSKALVTSYTMLMAKQRPEYLWSCVTPGFVDTKIVAGYGATKTPEEGAKPILHLLLEELEGNGFYYGSDAVRSPLHFMRNPGEPKYDGVFPL